MINTSDKAFLQKKGITSEQLSKQLDRFKRGFPFLKIHAAASTDFGVFQFPTSQIQYYLEQWEKYVSNKHQIVKFVPASGAASRMFKALFNFLDSDYVEPKTEFEKQFFSCLTHFAFYPELNSKCKSILSKTATELVENKKYKELIRILLCEEGLNYGQLPKGLLLFHQYGEDIRTAFEEHLVEGALYAKQADGTAHIHFTVSKEHIELFKALVQEQVPQYEQKYQLKYNISFSEQKEYTDTLAVDVDNVPIRLNGQLLFRPGGHGALIENLNDLSEEIVFIKNIDNVVPDYLKAETVRYKKLLAGVLVYVQKQIFSYLELLNSGKYTHEQVIDILYFVQRQLCCKNPQTKFLEDAELVLYLIRKLNRPIRVCGMVQNVGEPGGGPFLAYNPDGTYSPQILESSQIDMTNEASVKMFQEGTHFNPVDLVCGLYDYQGNKFNLPDYVDPETGFISSKSQNGKALKALELPGLWNGAMSDWNTIFVEVPLSTFNPVKTVNDLLRKEHQPA